MSHVTDVKLKIHDLDALERACDTLGLELRRGQTTYKWYGRFMNDSRDFGTFDPKTFGKGQHAIRSKDYVDGDYEIGVVTTPDGDGYHLLVDTWGPGQKLVNKCDGPELNKLRREYAAEVAGPRAISQLSRHGWRMQREERPGGGIRLKLRKR